MLRFLNGGNSREEKRRQNAYFFKAAKDGNTGEVERLLGGASPANASSRKVDDRDEDNSGMTALHYASYYGHRTLVQLLSKKFKANIYATDLRHYNTPLMMAAANGHTEIVRDLLQHQTTTPVSIVTAQQDGDSNTYSYLDHQTNTGGTALMAASFNGHTDIVKDLIKRGANVNIQSYSGGTALMAAAQNGHVVIVQELLLQGADIRFKDDKNGNTALLFACVNGHVGVVREILQWAWAANIQTTISIANTTVENTPLHYSCQRGDLDITKLLLQHGGASGADAETSNNNNNTNSSKKKRHGGSASADDPIQLLRRTNAAGHTPLDLALEHGHDAIVQLLTAYSSSSTSVGASSGRGRKPKPPPGRKPPPPGAVDNRKKPPPPTGAVPPSHPDRTTAPTQPPPPDQPRKAPPPAAVPEVRGIV